MACLRALRSIYVRFVLTHLPKPEDMLARGVGRHWRRAACLSSKTSTMHGKFCDPPNQAFERHAELYIAAAQKRGVDPFVGRRLVRLLEDAGFANVDTSLVQPFGRERRCQAGRARSPSPPLPTDWWRKA